jgi:hypothetical protein
LTVVSGTATTSPWFFNPIVLGPVILALTLALILVGYAVLTQRQVGLMSVTAQVEAESLAHDKALLKIETMQSPLRITSEQVAANRLVPPVAIVQIQAVPLDTPVRPISYVYEPKFVPPVAPVSQSTSTPRVNATSEGAGISLATPGTTASAPSTTPTVPQVATASGAIPPTVGK